MPGVEGAWSHPFNDWLAVDTGLFAGGGGGAAAPVGGGLMLRPHLDLVFRFPGFYTGPTWSKVWFTSGQINSNQVGWMLNVDSSFRYRPAAFTGAATDGSATGLGFDHVDAMVTIAQAARLDQHGRRAADAAHRPGGPARRAQRRRPAVGGHRDRRRRAAAAWPATPRCWAPPACAGRSSATA